MNGLETDVPEWLRKPERYNDGAATLAEIVEHAVTGQGLHGAGYFWAAPMGQNAWTITPLEPERVSVELVQSHTGSRRIWRLDGRAVDTARRFTTRENRAGLLVIPHRYLPGIAEPIGPIQAARYSVAGYLQTESYGADVFGSGIPQGVLSTPQEITPDTGARYRDDWMLDARQKPVRVLGNGLTFAPFKLSPKDAAWLDARRFDAEEVARLFGVPAYKLNLAQNSGMVYNNAESLDRDFLRGCIAGGYLRPVESALNALTPGGRNASEELVIEFKYAGLLVPTTSELFDTFAIGIQNGFYTLDEVRTMLKLPPLPPAPETAPPALPVAPTTTDDSGLEDNAAAPGEPNSDTVEDADNDNV
jgi:HK97 family phage portal protein